MPSRRSEKLPSNRKSCTQTRSSNWQCSWLTLNCTKGTVFTPRAGYQSDSRPGMSLPAPFRPGCCYETAMTRKFYHGRTETMRPCTLEAVRWCTAMTDPSCNVCWSKLRVCRGWWWGRGLTPADLCSGRCKEESHAVGLWEAQQTDGRGPGRTRWVTSHVAFLSQKKRMDSDYIFVQALTGTFLACISSPKRREAPPRSSS